MASGNGTKAPTPPESFRLDRQTGEVIFTDRSGKERRLKPTMAATEQLESRLNSGIEVVRTRVAAACWPFAPHVAAEPKMIPTTAELAVVMWSGLQAAGERSLTVDDAKKLIWDVGRSKVVGALFEFTWACADGGRLREEDLKNGDSPSGSSNEPNGEDEAIDQLTAELTAGPSSGDSSE